MLRSAETIEVDELYRGYAEEAAIGHFTEQGWAAHHTENGLWPALFGLIFGLAVVPVVTARRIDDHYVYMRKAGRGFLESLPRI